MKARISNVITESIIKSWKPKENVLISAPMGSGKSYFCKNPLYKTAKDNNEKILMLIHRSNCVDQFAYEIVTAGKDDVITIMTYQAIEYAKLHNTLDKINLSQYRYIVCDEFHYFFNDSSFNNKTSISFELIMNNSTATHIFMSATGNNMENYMKKYIKENKLEKYIKYYLPFDFSFIRNLKFFYKEDTIEELIKEGIKKGSKGIFFIQSAEKAYKLYKKYKDYCVFNCSENNSTYYKFVDKEKIQKILQNECFEEQFLITTSCFDAGINIVDREVKHIVIDIIDFGSLIQCVGRKRIQDGNDKLNVYIHALTNQKLSGLIRNMQQKVEMAKYFIDNDYSIDKLIQKYPMQNDCNNILYDDLCYDINGKVVPNTYIKRVNGPMYFKRQEDIKEYKNIMTKYGEFGYCKYLAEFFGFYDKKKGVYKYKMISEQSNKNKNKELQKYLKKLADNKTIFLQPADRTELIHKINLIHNGKIMKRASTLNHMFEEENTPYRIKEFETLRTITDANGNKKQKKYKYAWTIVNF